MSSPPRRRRAARRRRRPHARHEAGHLPPAWPTSPAAVGLGDLEPEPVGSRRRPALVLHGQRGRLHLLQRVGEMTSPVSPSRNAAKRPRSSSVDHSWPKRGPAPGVVLGLLEQQLGPRVDRVARGVRRLLPVGGAPAGQGLQAPRRAAPRTTAWTRLRSHQRRRARRSPGSSRGSSGPARAALACSSSAATTSSHGPTGVRSHRPPLLSACRPAPWGERLADGAVAERRTGHVVAMAVGQRERPLVAAATRDQQRGGAFLLIEPMRYWVSVVGDGVGRRGRGRPTRRARRRAPHLKHHRRHAGAGLLPPPRARAAVARWRGITSMPSLSLLRRKTPGVSLARLPARRPARIVLAGERPRSPPVSRRRPPRAARRRTAPRRTPLTRLPPGRQLPRRPCARWPERPGPPRARGGPHRRHRRDRDHRLHRGSPNAMSVTFESARSARGCSRRTPTAPRSPPSS